MKKNGWTGFTLLEMLVVTAVIAILFSILMPSLRKAKDKAREIECANNMRQTGIALIQYASDNDGYGVIYRDAVTTRSWDYGIVTDKYVTNPQVILCPVWAPSIYRRGYGYAYGIYYSNAVTTTGRILNKQSPSTSVYLGDSIRHAAESDGSHYQWYFFKRLSNVEGHIHLRHSRKTNIFFLDGHTGLYDLNGLVENFSWVDYWY